MVPIATPYSSLRTEGASSSNPMLSLSSFPYNTPFCRAQHGSEFLRFQFPPDNSQYYNNWQASAKEPSLLNVRGSEAELSDIVRRNIYKHQNEGAPSSLEQMQCSLGNVKLNAPPEPAASDSKVSCQGYPAPMKGADELAMTGSSNQRAEQLSWLADVATGGVRAAQNSSPSSPGHDKDTGPPLLHNSECLAPRSSLNSILLGVSPVNQRMYTPYHPERFHPSHQTTGGGSGGTRLSLYYTQASRTAPYSSFYHTEHRLPYSQVMGDGLLSPGRLPHPYYQGEMYSPAMTSIASVQLPSAHGPLPHSPSYLHSTASLSPVGVPTSPSSPQSRMAQQPSGILVNRSAEGLISHDHEKSSLPVQVACNSPQYHREERRKSYKSPEPKNLSPSLDSLPQTAFPTEIPSSKDLSLRQNASPSHLSYKVPTGKEGSLKHRILRPPSINIVDPPSTMLDAPLSAPPIRSHTESSPKQMRQDNYPTYRSFSSSGALVLEGSHVLAPPQATAASFVVPTTASASPVSASVQSNLPDTGSPLKYPHAFMKGSIIQLANSQLKPVELMTTEDFIECEALSSNLKIDSSSVISIEKMPVSGSAKLGFSVGQNKLQITVEAPLEHPFFVYKQGWASCSPKRSFSRYGLTCSKLKVGDTCIFLTVKNEKQASKSEASPAPPVFVPTSHPVPEPKTENFSLEASKTDSEKPKTAGLQKPQPPANVPFVQKTSLFLASDKSDEAKENGAVTKKRKRRWSAPGEVSHVSLSDL